MENDTRNLGETLAQINVYFLKILKQSFLQHLLMRVKLENFAVTTVLAAL